MVLLKYNDMIQLDATIRKGLGETVVYLVYTEQDGYKTQNHTGPRVFLKCEDALKYAKEFAYSISGCIRQEIHKLNEAPKITTFTQIIVDDPHEIDSYIGYQGVL